MKKVGSYVWGHSVLFHLKQCICACHTGRAWVSTFPHPPYHESVYRWHDSFYVPFQIAISIGPRRLDDDYVDANAMATQSTPACGY